MTAKSILIVGAGELGLSLIDAFLAHPSKSSVSVMLREKSSSIATLSARYHTSNNSNSNSSSLKIVYGDISSSVENLAGVLAGFDIVISATGFSSGPGSQLKLAQAALKAKVGHYVPWQFGVDYDTIGRGSSQPLFDEQLDVRDLLRGQERAHAAVVPWTIISTGLFTSFLFDPAFGVVNVDQEAQTIRVKALGSLQNRLTITSAQNIGIYTSRILLDGATPIEGVVFVADDTITFDQVADAISEKAVRDSSKSSGGGWKLNRTEATVGELESALSKNQDDVGAKYSLIWARAKGVAWEKESSWNWKNGLRGQDLQDWVEKNLELP
ncbi:hypothetical protein I316_06155 [Kwoniella heveanensis BCC8398]|uniref:NmrA-like domain-containing protein n=1 Tax=Kwoniella heveanensis BCC8398 TaxID=1296120 RepID=A0A1B9GMD2_9TREE|nr:hypothetical protein I316_06155 [Kwoniella heveanensis BCC8398]